MTTSRYDVFVSYAHDDLDWVHAFADRLQQGDIRVAIDKLLIEPGDVIVHEVEQAIRDSAHGLLVFSPAAVASGWVMEEYATLMRHSIEDGRLFIPIVIKDVELPGFAKSRYYLDFRGASGAEYERLIERLIQSLKRRLATSTD